MTAANITSFYSRNRYGFLFYTLLLSLLLVPLSRPLGIGNAIVQVFLVVNLLAGAMALRAARLAT